MTDDKFRPVSLIWIILAVIMLVIFIDTAWASGNDIDTTATSDASGVLNNSVRDSSTAYGVGGSDADINNCRYTAGGLTIQWTHKDKLCWGMELIRAGYVDTGVLVVCKTWIGDLYSDLVACQAAMVQKYEPVVVEEAVDDDEEDYHEEFEQAQQAYQENLGELEGRVVRLESRRPAQQVTREVIQQPFLSDEKRAKLKAVLDQ